MLFRSSVKSAAKQIKKAGFASQTKPLNFLFHQASEPKSFPPLTEFMTGTPPTDYSAKPVAPTTEVSKLANGITVVTQDVPYEPLSHVGIYVKAGSRNETPEEFGASHFLQKMAFKSTTLTSELRLTRELEKTGATVSASSSREDISYQIEALRGAVPQVLSLVSQMVLLPRLHTYDIESQKQTILQEIEDFAANPQLLVGEALHNVAFRNNTLGNPLVCPPHQAEAMTRDTLVAFHEKHFNGSGIILSGTNVNHQQFVEMANLYFGEAPSAATTTTAPATAATPKYTGGEALLHENRLSYPEDIPRTQIAVGFKGVGTSSNDFFASNVLQAVLGAGFNVYNPSTAGRLSRLSQNVVARNPYIFSAQAFNLTYSDAGLLGVFIDAKPQNAQDAVNAVVEELRSAAGSITQEQVERAKKIVQFNIFRNLERRSGVSEANFRNVRDTNAVVQASDLAARIQAVTVDDVKRVLTQALQSAPTLAAYGDLTRLGGVDAIQKL